MRKRFGLIVCLSLLGCQAVRVTRANSLSLLLRGKNELRVNRPR